MKRHFFSFREVRTYFDLYPIGRYYCMSEADFNEIVYEFVITLTYIIHNSINESWTGFPCKPPKAKQNTGFFFYNLKWISREEKPCVLDPSFLFVDPYSLRVSNKELERRIDFS